MTDAALAKLIARYYRDDAGNLAAMLNYYRGLPDLAATVRKAALALDENNKMNSHQRRIGYARLEPFAIDLRSKLAAIKSCTTFAQLHDFIESHSRLGIGPLAIYDTALRIGARLRLTPDVVYLHSGTKTGALNLGLGRGVKQLQRHELPAPMAAMEMPDIENFLCIFKDRLKGNARASHCGPVKARGLC